VATFAFKALDLQGAPTIGEIEAEEKSGVSAQLRSKGLIVLDIEEKQPASAGDLLARFKRVKARELTVLTRQLATMVSSGMSLIRAFAVLEDQTENAMLKEALGQIRSDIEAGASLANALRAHPRIFNELYVAMVEAGETGGILESTLARVADQLEKDDSLKRQVKAAMMYPAVIISFAFLVLAALLAFIVPVFVEVFRELGGELPLITRLTVGMSNVLVERWYLVIGGAVGLAYGFKRWKSSSSGRAQWDSLKLRVPWKIGDIVQKVALARFSRTFSALTTAGVPMLAAIDITGRTSGNKVVEKAMNDVRDSVMSGGTLSEPMSRSPQAFPLMVCQMIGVGEETGALETMLTKIADFYEDEVAAAVKALTSILEPLMIVVVGAIVGFVVISMYMPMFTVYDQIK